MKDNLSVKTTNYEVTIRLVASILLCSMLFILSFESKNFDFTQNVLNQQQTDLNKHWNANLFNLEEVEIIDIYITFPFAENQNHKNKIKQHTLQSYFIRNQQLSSIFLDIAFPPPRNLNFA
jgi:hypothetical protein